MMRVWENILLWEEDIQWIHILGLRRNWILHGLLTNLALWHTPAAKFCQGQGRADRPDAVRAKSEQIRTEYWNDLTGISMVIFFFVNKIIFPESGK